MFSVSIWDYGSDNGKKLQRKGWNKWGDCLLCKWFQSKGIGKIKAFLVYHLVNFLNDSHVYSSLNTRLVECLTHSRCTINIYWIRWLVKWSLNIRFFSIVRVNKCHIILYAPYALNTRHIKHKLLIYHWLLELSSETTQTDNPFSYPITIKVLVSHD